MTKDQLAEAFSNFDKDGNKFLSPEEIFQTMNELGVEITLKEVHELVKEIDENNDGKISYEEFLEIWNN